MTLLQDGFTILNQMSASNLITVVAREMAIISIQKMTVKLTVRNSSEMIMISMIVRQKREILFLIQIIHIAFVALCI